MASTRAVLGVFMLCGLWGCTERPSAAVEDPVPQMGSELLGTWETEGVDPALGPVRVRMQVERDGSLLMTLFMETGGQRSFPGSWLLEGDEWVLRGAYFGEAGQQRVRWKLEEKGRLILEDEEGRQQVWMRG